MSAADEQSVPCPACQAPAGSPCTQPTDTGRRAVKRTHLPRVAAAQEAARQASVPESSPIVTVAETLLAALESDLSVMYLACACGRDLEWSTDVTVADVRALLEHAAFDHVLRYEIHVYRSSLLLSANELGLLLRLDPLTESESQWRRKRAANLT